jgi:hypothetical protein
MLSAYKKYLNWTGIGLSLNVINIVGSLITLIYFSVMLARMQDYDYVYYYKPATCTPIFGEVVRIPCGSESLTIGIQNSSRATNLPQSSRDVGKSQNDVPKIKYIAMFSTLETYTMIEDPFSIRETYDQAEQDLASYVLNVPYDCYCRQWNQKVPLPSPDACQLWSVCISETDFIQYIQRDNGHYKATYVAFIVSSLISIVFSALAIWVALKVLWKVTNGEEYPLFNKARDVLAYDE